MVSGQIYLEDIMNKLAITICSAFLFTGTAAFAQDDTQAKINTILEALAAQEEVIKSLKTETDNLKLLSQQQASLITKLTGELKAEITKREAVTAIAARLETALPANGSLWLNGQKVIDEGGGWHRSYGNTGWFNGTHGGGWHMTDNNWIRSYGGKDVYVDKMVRADNGFQVDGKQVIDADAGWHRSYGNTGWFNGTHGGGWHMTDTSWIRSYGNKNVYVNKMLRADDGFQVDGKAIIDGSGKVLVSPQYSKEYYWIQGNAPVKMQPTNQYVCYLMSASGRFAGSGEKISVYEIGGWWYLGGQSLQPGGDINGTARCVTFR
jgi:hypothetical protein